MQSPQKIQILHKLFLDPVENTETTEAAEPVVPEEVEVTETVETIEITEVATDMSYTEVPEEIEAVAPRENEKQSENCSTCTDHTTWITPER